MGSKYFQTTRRGELYELKQELNSSHKDKKKEAVKKVIAAMTVGKDVSVLFPDIVNCMQTNNIELKKLVYLYMINYSSGNPELAILAVNTFRKDSMDSNPLIRALAVRTMGCIRIPAIAEYLIEPLKRCCNDTDPYVRKSSAICIAKLYSINPGLVEIQGFIDILISMIRGGNPAVVANAISSLNEISETSPKHYLSEYINDDWNNVDSLLSSLNESSEWGQVCILDAINLYDPRNRREANKIMNKIIPRFSHSNAAVILSSLRITLKVVECLGDDRGSRKSMRDGGTKRASQDGEIEYTYDKIMSRLSSPILTLLTTEPEIQYVALKNIELILLRYPYILENDAKMFFIKYNDPIYIKLQKLTLLSLLANSENTASIFKECGEYAREIEIEVSHKSIETIGQIGLKLEDEVDRGFETLVSIKELRMNHINQQIVKVIKDWVRRYPNKFEKELNKIIWGVTEWDDAEAKSALIWLIGEYSVHIEKIGSYTCNFLTDAREGTIDIKLQILTATVKLYLTNPSGYKDLLEKMLRVSTEQTTNPDLRDRAFGYWRMLSHNPQVTKDIVLAAKPRIKYIRHPLENHDPATLDLLLGQISTLSSVYHKLPETFVSATGKTLKKKKADDPTRQESFSSPASSSPSDSGDESQREATPVSTPTSSPPASPRERKTRKGKRSAPVVDLLDF